MVLHNPNGPEGYITTFKDLGSFISIYELIQSGNSNIQVKLAASVAQQSYDYGTVQSLSTYINNMVSCSSNLSTAKTNLVSAVSNYLTTVTGPDLASTSTTASGVIADLISQMQGATQGAAVSGILVLLSGHYYNFFWQEYGIVLPQTSGSIILAQSESMSLISGTLPSIRRQISETYAT